MGLFDPGIRSIIGDLGLESHYDVSKADRVLDWRARPIEETVVDCARSLIERGRA